MTPQQIVGLAVRLFSVWLVFMAFQFIGSGIATNSQQGTEPSSAYFLAGGVAFILAVVLWLFPMFLAHKLVPRTQFKNTLSVPANEAVVVACVIMGLWLFVARMLPEIAHLIALAVAFKVNNQPLSLSDEFTTVRLGRIAIELVVVWVLCFKAHAVSEFFVADRGLPQAE